MPKPLRTTETEYDAPPMLSSQDALSYSRFVIRDLRNKLEEKIRRRFHYLRLFCFLFFVAWFLAVLCLQRQANVAYAVHSTLSAVLTPKASFSVLANDVFDWLSGTVAALWKDPLCGDGICKAPWEFASYSTFGCRADCGKLPVILNLTKIQIDLYWNFSHPEYSIPVLLLMQQAKWNLCPQTTAYSSNCYFADIGDNTFERPMGSFTLVIDDIPDGQWELKIKRDPFMKVTGAVRDLDSLTHAAYYYKIHIAAVAAQAEQNSEASLLQSAYDLGRSSLLDFVLTVLKNREGNETAALFQRQQLINATCMCDSVAIEGNTSFVWGTQVLLPFNATPDHFTKPTLFNISTLPAYKTTYCDNLGAASPILTEYVLVNVTTNGTVVFGAMTGINAVTYTTVNITQPVVNVTGMCYSAMQRLQAQRNNFYLSMRQNLVDQRAAIAGRAQARRTTSLRPYIQQSLPELEIPIFVAPLGSNPLGDPLDASMASLQALYLSGITYSTQPGPAALNLVKKIVYANNLTTVDMSNMAMARINEIQMQQLEINMTEIPSPTGYGFPSLTVAAIRTLLIGAGATNVSLPNPNDTALGVLSIDYNLAFVQGNTTAYQDCDLQNRAPDYVGTCVPMLVSCNATGNDIAPWQCANLRSGASIAGDLSVVDYRVQCEQPCDTQHNCEQLCECYGTCGALETCSCKTCTDLNLDAATDTEFANIIYAGLEVGQVASSIAATTSTRRLMQLSDAQLSAELDGSITTLGSVQDYDNALADDIVQLQSDVSASYVASLELSRDDTLARLITASTKDIAKGQATVLSRLVAVIGRQDVALAAAEEVAQAVAAVEGMSRAFADASMSLQTSLQSKVLAIGIAVQNTIATLQQALALWKRVRLDRAVANKEATLANFPCTFAPLMAYPFELNRSNFVVEQTPRERVVGTNNRLIGGMLIHTKRAIPTTCSGSKFKLLDENCRGSRTIKPYGVDPIFNPVSSMYDATYIDSGNSIMLSIYDTCAKLANPTYNVVDGNSTTNPPPYCAEVFNPFQLPWAFQPFSLKEKPDGFPLYLDINLGEEQAADVMKYIKESQYIDASTESVSAELVTYNAPLRLFGYFYTRIDMQDSGSRKYRHKMQTIRVDLYYTSEDSVRFAMEIILACMVAGMLGWSLWGVALTWRKHHSLRPWFTAYNVFNLFCDALMVTTVIMWWIIVCMYANNYDISLRYEVYNKLGVNPNAWSMLNAGLGLRNFWDATTALVAISDLMAWYFSLNAINILLLIARLHIYIEFQPQLGMVPKTLVRAASDLGHFVLICLIIFFAFSAFGHICLGTTMEGFSTFPWSINTCFEFLLGNVDIFVEFRMATGPTKWIAITFFYIFHLFMIFVMLNFLLAIICDAFSKVARESGDQDSIVTDLGMIWRDGWHKFTALFSKQKPMSENELRKILNELAGDTATPELGEGGPTVEELPGKGKGTAVSESNEISEDVTMIGESTEMKGQVGGQQLMVDATRAPKPKPPRLLTMDSDGQELTKLELITALMKALEKQDAVDAQSKKQDTSGAKKWQSLACCKGAPDLVLAPKGFNKQTDRETNSKAPKSSMLEHHESSTDDAAEGETGSGDEGGGSVKEGGGGAARDGDRVAGRERNAALVDAAARTLMKRWGQRNGGIDVNGDDDGELKQSQYHEPLSVLSSEEHRQNQLMEAECEQLGKSFAQLSILMKELDDEQRQLVREQRKVAQQQALLEKSNK